MSALIWSNAGRPKATIFSWSMRLAGKLDGAYLPELGVGEDL